MSETPERLAARLERLVRQTQREKRAPSISAAVLRDGELIYETAVGVADVAADLEATPDTQYRIGSITKTFTAAAIMQLRDAGKLDLEDSLDRHVEGAAHTPTIRRLLSHASGLQRETQDDSWLTLRFAPPDELLETLAEAEFVLPSGARFHYSNLAFALLGIVVERVSGLPYQDYVRERLFEPVGLTRVSFEPEPPAAKGYLAQPYADGVWDTIGVETGAWASAGQLWATAGDICRWGAFLADPDESVLASSSAEEMRTVQAIADHERWLSGYGLGLGLYRDGDRILAGHGGSMPGFIATLGFSAAEKVVVTALTNESEADISELGRRAAGDDGRGVAGRARDVADRRAAARRRRAAARHLVHGGGAARVPLAGGQARGAVRRDPGLAAVLRLRAGDGRSLADGLGAGARRGAAHRPRGGRLGGAHGLGRLPGHARARPVESSRLGLTRTAGPRGRSASRRGARGRSPRADPR